MLTLRVLFVFLMLIIASVVYSVYAAADQPNVSVRVTPRSPHQAKTTEQQVISAVDNDNGTISINISACGALIEVVAKREAIMQQDPEVQEAAQAAMHKACD